MPSSYSTTSMPCSYLSSANQSTRDTQHRLRYRLAFAIPKLLLAISTGISISAIAQDSERTYLATDSAPSSMTQTNLLLINTSTVATNRAAPQINWSGMVTAHSPAQPIAAFIKDWDEPLTSGKHAYAQGRMALDVRPAGSAISYGLGWRYDYLMEFNQETANLYWQYQNNQLPNQDQTYPIQLEAKHNERVGANIGFTQQLVPNWQLTTYANIWRGLHAIEGNALGTLTSQALIESETIRNIDRLNSIKTDLNYYYDKPALGEEENLNWYPDKPAGYGYSLDVQLTGQLSDKTALSIRGYDVLGRMHWQDMPSTQYVLDYDIDRSTTDKTRGQLLTNDITQTLPWRAEGSLTHQVNDKWQLGAHGQANDIESLYQLSAGYQIDHATIPIVITGLVEPQTKAIGLAVDTKYGGIKLLTDDLDSEKAKRSEISLYGRYTW